MTKIVGHRGARNIWPENSLNGFRRTLELAVDAIEFDVHLTDAHELLVIHDATLDRTVDGTGEVRSVTPEQRQQLRLTNSTETIPTLGEVLELFAASRPLELHIELKAAANGEPYPGLEALTAQAIARFGLADRSILTSFNLEVLERCRAVAPAIPRLLSINARSTERLGLVPTLKRADDFVTYIAVHKELLATAWDEITATIPLERLDVWTVNDREELQDWLARGTRYVTSDDPVLALEIRGTTAVD